MKKYIPAIILLTFLLQHSVAALAQDPIDGVNLSLTRIIFDSEDHSESVKVNNNTKNQTWLLRSWVSKYNSNEQNKDFIITPPLYRISPDESIQLRIDDLNHNLPQDRESVFHINVLAIPPKPQLIGDKPSQPAASGVQFAINNRIKLLYRPHSLNDPEKVKQAFKSLKATATATDVNVQNPTPYYITMDDVKINGTKVTSVNDFMVAPFSTLAIPGKNARTFSYSTINDYGAKDPVIDVKF